MKRKVHSYLLSFINFNIDPTNNNDFKLVIDLFDAYTVHFVVLLIPIIKHVINGKFH